ncbi:uncharacterized protein VTP21DRAFT_3349 [Calcarisporiella thermophila]|uniref:uncharacterized protein n=1 Tax=Calcarisporiella thermophila TaxID=911321 RepID=UPI00374303F0
MRRILVLATLFCCVLGDTLLKLDYGMFNGTNEDGLTVWRGVPFAKPPVGDLRFRAPQPPQRFSSLQQADKFGNSCIQFVNMTAPNNASEDCLSLNIWKPANAQNLPIVFWIHGGAFLLGSSAMDVYDGSRLVKQSNNSIIFVSSNYRLGALGFLASDEILKDGDLNAGLLDQRMALEWVRKYATLFGGDPTRITAMGESAGAISIGLHLVSSSPKNTKKRQRLSSRQEKAPLQRPFDRAILSSGSSTSAYNCMTYKSFQPVYNALVENVNCSNANNTLECLRKSDITVLHTAGVALAESTFPQLKYPPVAGGEYISKGCSDVLDSRQFLDVPLIVGTNTNEGTLFANNIPSNTTEEYISGLKKIIPCISNSTIQDLIKLYPEEKEIPQFDTRLSLPFGDMTFICPAYKLAKAYSTNVYKYRFNQPDGPLGARHGGDIPYMFHNVANLTASEAQLSDIMTNYYISFIRSGDPNAHTPYIKWPKFAGERIKFEAENTELEKDTSDNEICTYWNSHNYNCQPDNAKNEPKDEQ